MGIFRIRSARRYSMDSVPSHSLSKRIVASIHRRRSLTAEGLGVAKGIVQPSLSLPSSSILSGRHPPSASSIRSDWSVSSVVSALNAGESTTAKASKYASLIASLERSHEEASSCEARDINISNIKQRLGDALASAELERAAQEVATRGRFTPSTPQAGSHGSSSGHLRSAQRQRRRGSHSPGRGSVESAGSIIRAVLRHLPGPAAAASPPHHDTYYTRPRSPDDVLRGIVQDRIAASFFAYAIAHYICARVCCKQALLFFAGVFESFCPLATTLTS